MDKFKIEPTKIFTRVVGPLIGFLIIFIILFSLHSWRGKKAETVEALFNVMALESHAIDSYFTNLESAMRVLARDLGDLETSDTFARGFVIVQHFHESHPELYNITVIQADGQILFTARNPPDPNLPSLAKEPSFLQFKEESDKSQAIIIGRPLMSVINKQWIIPIRYQLRNADGRLNHVISANLSLTFLQEFWKEAPFTQKAALGLVRDDGYLVGRYPVPPKVDNVVIYGQSRSGALMSHLREQHFPSKGYVEGISNLDGPDILSTYLRLEHFPLTLFIALPVRAIRDAWWDKVMMSYILAAAMLAAGIIFYFFALAEEAKKKSSQLYRSLFEQSHAINLLIEPASETIVDVNQAACTFYGYHREQLLGMRITDINTISLPQMQAVMAEVISERGGYFLFSHRLASGEIRDVEVYSNPLQLEGRLLLHSIVHDITKRKRAEEALRKNEEELKTLNDELECRVEQRTYELQAVQQQYLHAEKLSAIGKLSASIAHEFNNPLQSVMTVLKGLKKTAGLDGGDLRMLELAISESERMKKLIASLRDFNRPSSDRKTYIDIHQTIESILTLIRSDLSKNKIDVTCDFSPHLPQIKAIHDQFKQVMLNLLTNAIDACAGAGKGQIAISTRREGERVAVAIRDTGVGIEAENMENIFRPFFTTKAEVKGTGLGLAVSYGIVKNHKGEIRVESEPGKGATFTVLLPINSVEDTLPSA